MTPLMSLAWRRVMLQLRMDLTESQIYICSPEVLMLFSDNFDFQNVRRDFITGVLSEEELGNKIFIHELKGEYGLRVDNLRAYDAVSRDIINRWTFPWVPDTNCLQVPPPPPPPPCPPDSLVPLLRMGMQRQRVKLTTPLSTPPPPLQTSSASNYIYQRGHVYLVGSHLPPLVLPSSPSLAPPSLKLPFVLSPA